MGFMQQGKATKINAARHWAAALALAGAAWAGAGAAWAASIPFEGRQVEMTAREQPVASFLQDFFGAVDIPVAVSSGVSGAINGTYSSHNRKGLKKKSIFLLELKYLFHPIPYSGHKAFSSL